MAIDKSLELGSPEAAVRSCTELMSMLFEQPVDKVAYYLDLYYQVRCTYEQQRRRNEASARFWEQFTRPEEPEPDVYQEPRRTMNEPTAPEVEAEEDDTSSGADAPPSPQGEGNAPPKDATGAAERQGRGSKSYGNHHAADAAAEKRRIRERLIQMRAAGLSTPAIIKAANGSITHDQIHDILGAVPVPIAVYRVLDGALEVLAGAAPER